MKDDAAKRLVREGYNAISYAYRDDLGAGNTGYLGWLARLTSRLADGDRVLDLGCGNGVPVSRVLSERFAVTGIDLSDVQIERARALVPQATFLRADMTEVELESGAFAAVVSFFSVIHVPVGQQPALMQRIASWIRPDGWLLVTLGHTGWTGTEENWYGARMYWSTTDADTYARWLGKAGFDVKERTFIPEGGSGHTIFLASRLASQ